MPFKGGDFFSCRHGPQPNRATCPERQQTSIRRKRHRTDILRMPFKGVLGAAVLHEQNRDQLQEWDLRMRKRIMDVALDSEVYGDP